MESMVGRACGAARYGPVRMSSPQTSASSACWGRRKERSNPSVPTSGLGFLERMSSEVISYMERSVSKELVRMVQNLT